MRETSKIFKRMSELNAITSRMDMHMHTTWTDGKASMREMLDRAESNGLTSVAVTDHIRQVSDYYTDYLEELETCRGAYSFALFSGFEAKINSIEGTIDIPTQASNTADIIIASVHRIPLDGTLGYPKDISSDRLALLEKQLCLTAIDNQGKEDATTSRINVIGHCGGMSISTYGTFPNEYFEDVIKACKKNDVAFEFNYKYHYRFEDEIKALLLQYDPFVSVGSDAHEIEKISNRSFVDG